MNREELQRNAEQQLAAWEKTAEELKAKLSEIGEDGREEFEERIRALRIKQDGLRTKVKELREAGDGAWDDLKEGFEAALQDVDAAWSDIKSGVGAAISHFREADGTKDGTKA